MYWEAVRSIQKKNTPVYQAVLFNNVCYLFSMVFINDYLLYRFIINASSAGLSSISCPVIGSSLLSPAAKSPQTNAASGTSGIQQNAKPFHQSFPSSQNMVGRMIK